MQEKSSALRELFNKHREVIMYLIFGGLTTLISWLVYSLCVELLEMSLYAANVASWIISVSFAFITNKLWVFESRERKAAVVAREALTFVGGRVATGAIEVFLQPQLVKMGLDQTLFGVWGLPAKIIVSVIIVILNYVISKFISFRSK